MNTIMILAVISVIIIMIMITIDYDCNCNRTQPFITVSIKKCHRCRMYDSDFFRVIFMLSLPVTLTENLIIILFDVLLCTSG